MTRSPLRLLLPLLALAPLAAQEVDLRTTAKKGSSVWLLQEQRQSQSFEVMGQEMESTQTTTRALHVTVEDVDDKGNLLVSVKIARVFGKVSNPNSDDIDFDSTKGIEAPEDDPTGGMMTQMLKSLQAGAGKAFKAKASPSGRMLELVDAKDVLAKGEEAPGLEEAQLKQMVESAFGRLPEKPVAKGGKWTYEDGGRNGRMPTKMVAELTLSKFDDEAFEIEAAGKIEKTEPQAGDGEDDNPMAAAMKSLKISNGKATGKQRISRKDGFLVESLLEGSMDAEMSMQGMSIPMTIKNKSITKRTTEADAMATKKEAPKAEAPKAEEPKKVEGPK